MGSFFAIITETLPVASDSVTRQMSFKRAITEAFPTVFDGITRTSVWYSGAFKYTSAVTVRAASRAWTFVTIKRNNQ